MNNFYQNHRRYVKSRDSSQLNGNYVPVDKLGDCDPIITVGDLWDYQKKNIIKAYDSKKNNLIMIGPEGDFSKSELEKAKLADFQFVSLGKNRLRAETAGMMACAIFSMIK